MGSTEWVLLHSIGEHDGSEPTRNAMGFQEGNALAYEQNRVRKIDANRGHVCGFFCIIASAVHCHMPPHLHYVNTTIDAAQSAHHSSRNTHGASTP